MGVVEWILLALVALGAVAALLGWDRYRGTRKVTSASARPTSETFTDPVTGKLMRVWYDPVTGEREYHTDSGAHE